MYRDIIVFDFETGGRNPLKCQPTLIAAIALDGRNFKLKGTFNSEMRPILDDDKAIKAGVDPVEDEALKITNNLALSGKIYGFSTAKDQLQVVGAGIQYFFGNAEKKSWVFAVPRADIKGLFSFQIKSFTFDIRKWIQWSILLFRVGVGSNYYKE